MAGRIVHRHEREHRWVYLGEDVKLKQFGGQQVRGDAYGCVCGVVQVRHNGCEPEPRARPTLIGLFLALLTLRWGTARARTEDLRERWKYEINRANRRARRRLARPLLRVSAIPTAVVLAVAGVPVMAGGATITATGTANWNTGAAWVGGTQPAAADDAVIPSGAVITVPASTTVQARSVTVQAGGTLIGAATTSILNIGDATAGAGNAALTIASGATITNTALWTINIVSTSSTLQTIDGGGKTLPNVTLNPASGGNYTVTSGLAMSATTTFTHTGGNLHLDGPTDNAHLTHNIGKFVSSSSVVRTLDLGFATFNLTGSAVYWNLSGSANLTFNGANSTITQSGVAPGTLSTFTTGGTAGGRVYGTLRLLSGGESAIGVGTNTVAVFSTLERSGTPTLAGGNHLSMPLPAQGTVKVTGTFKAYGVSEALRVMLWPGSNAIPATLDLAGATRDLQYVSAQDITFKNGGANLDLSGTLGGFGDAGGNTLSGGGTLTFTAAVPQAWTQNTAGNWSDPTKWTTRIPLPQDPIAVTANFTGSPTITVDMPWMGLDFDGTGGSGAYTLNSALPNGGNFTGNWRGRAGMTLTNSASCTFYWNSRRTTDTFTFGGATITAPAQWSSANGGTSTFTDSGSFGAAFQHRAGPLVIPAAVTVAASTYISNATSLVAPASMKIDGNLDLTNGTGSVFSLLNGPTLSTYTGSGRIRITSTNATLKTFAGGGGAYGPQLVGPSGTGGMAITGNNSFAQVPSFPNGGKLVLPAGGTQTFAGGSNFGNGTNVLTIVSSVAATPTTFAKPNGKIRADFLSIQDVTTTGAGFSAGANSTNVSGNTGPTFTAPTTPDERALALLA
jgi:hypothetical protein